MKRKKLNMLNAVDDDLIDRANPDKIAPKRRLPSFRMMSMLAACLALTLIAVNLAIFLPMGNDDPPIGTGSGSQGQHSPGGEDSSQPSTSYEAIKELLEANRMPQYGGGDIGGTNNDGSTGIAPGFPEADEDTSSGVPTNKPNGEYVEVTDNQVNGVIEADIFKRTKTHIFYLRGAYIYAYSIDGSSSKEVGSLMFTDTYYYGSYEMYLSADGKIATIIHSKNGYPNYETCISLIDVSSPEKMKPIKCTTIKGQYEDSRYVDGELLVFTRFFVKKTDTEADYIPAIDDGDGFNLLSPSQIIVPQKINKDSYFVVSKISEKNLSYNGSLALLGFDSTLYVSQNNVYATRGFSTNKTENNIYSYANYTEIVRINYTDDVINAEGSITVSGSIKDQYCMDEYEGVLRVFTTESKGQYLIYNGDISVSSGNVSSNEVSGGVAVTPDISIESSRRQINKDIRSASLYCIELGDEMTIVASVECFAPQGETVQSARFNGDSAYVCTAIVFTDPVFVFDLSDLKNITYKDTGVIEGYSHSLIELEGGLLLGIGESDWSTLKLELYQEGENGLDSLSKVEIENAYGTSEYKAHYVNRTEMVFGFAYGDMYEGTRFYSIYKIVDNEIVLVSKTRLHGNEGYIDNCRGVLIDDYFYILTDNKGINFYVININK